MKHWERASEDDEMARIRYDPELKIATSEYKSDIGYLVREFEIEAERNRLEMKKGSERIIEEGTTEKKPILTRLFDKRRTPR